MKKLIRHIRKAHDQIYKQYLQDVKENRNFDITIVGGIYQTLVCEEFYVKEKELVYDMLDEFYCYCLLGKNFLHILAGEERPAEHLKDYRQYRVIF